MNSGNTRKKLIEENLLNFHHKMLLHFLMFNGQTQQFNSSIKEPWKIIEIMVWPNVIIVVGSSFFNNLRNIEKTANLLTENYKRERQKLKKEL